MSRRFFARFLLLLSTVAVIAETPREDTRDDGQEGWDRDEEEDPEVEPILLYPIQGPDLFLPVDGSVSVEVDATVKAGADVSSEVIIRTRTTPVSQDGVQGVEHALEIWDDQNERWFVVDITEQDSSIHTVATLRTEDLLDGCGASEDCTVTLRYVATWLSGDGMDIEWDVGWDADTVHVQDPSLYELTPVVE